MSIQPLPYICISPLFGVPLVYASSSDYPAAKNKQKNKSHRDKSIVIGVGGYSLSNGISPPILFTAIIVYEVYVGVFIAFFSRLAMYIFMNI